MSLNRRAPKRDGNEAEIIQALRQCGAMVTQLSSENVPDLLVIHPSIGTVLIEVKTPKGKLSDGQREWIETAMQYGANVEVVHSVKEALMVIDIEYVE